MFLAIKEILHEKFRYGLIMAMFILISYLMLILMGLMLGLANENTAAIKSWDTQTVFLNKDSNDSLSQSLITKDQVKGLSKNDALVGATPVVIETSAKTDRHKENIQFVGLDRDQFIYQDQLELVSGHRAKNDHQIVLDESMKDKGYRLGEKVTLNSLSQKYEVVGFAKNAKLNIAPIAYGSLGTWRKLKGANSSIVASGIFSNQKQAASNEPQLAHYTVKEFIDKLPGYRAQNTTFIFMISFLMVISLIIIAVFLYILTMQKMANFAVLRAQGVPAKHLISSTLAQAIILVLVGDIGGIILTELTSLMLPTSIPILMNWPLILGLSSVMIILGILGALLPVRLILKIDPVEALN